MSANAALFLIATLITGKYLLKCIKRIHVCFIGSIFLIISLMGFGFLDLLDDPQLIITLTFVFQMLGGCGTGMIIPSSMAIVSCYKERREEFIGYME